MSSKEIPDNDPLEPVKQRTAALKREREKGVGEVGIFWFFQGILFASSFPHTLGEAYGDFVNGLDDHVTFWPRLQKSFRQVLPALAEFEYDQVPRGRVVYRKADDTFLLYGSERFARDEIQQRRVMKDFQLVGKRIIVKPDEHYGPVQGMLEDD